MFETVKKIIKSDTSRVKHNKIAVIILCGLVILPSFYAWFNILASWDPYGNTNGVKIGVVNEDAGSKIFTTDVNAGQEVIDSLKDNDKLGWTFYDNRDAALSDTKNGKIFATIIIPSDFSQKLCTLVDEKPVKPVLEYHINEKLNAIAPKMAESGAKNIKNEITIEFIKTAVDKVFSRFGKIGKDADGKPLDLPRIKQFANGVNDEMPTIDERMGSILEDTNNYLGKIQQKKNDLNKLKGVLGRTGNITKNLSEDLPKLSEDVKKLTPVQEQTLYDLRFLGKNVSILSDDLDKLSGDTVKFSSEMSGTVDNIQNSISNISSMGTNLGAGIHNDIAAQVQMIQKPLGELGAKSQGYIKGQVPKDEYIAYLSAYGATLKALGENVSAIKAKWDELYAALSKAIAAASTSASTGTADPALVKQLSEIKTELDTANAQINGAIAGFKQLFTELGGYVSTANAPKILETLQKINGALGATMGQMTDMENKVSKGVGDTLGKLSEKLASTETMLDSANKVAGSKATGNTIDTMRTLNSNIHSLTDILLEDYDEKMDAVTGYIDDSAVLATDTTWLLGYLNRTAGNAQELLDFIDETGNWAVEDIQKVRDRWPDITNQTNHLTEQINTLDEDVGLKRLVGIMNNDPKVESEYFGEPVDLKTISMFSTTNYGGAMTPFYTTLCLWIGAIILGAVLTTEAKNTDFIPQPKELYMGKFAEFGLLSAMQGFLAAVGDIVLFRLKLDQPGLFILLCIFTSIVFTAVIYCLVSTIGIFGKAIAIILLIIQIGGSGGTFPVQVAPVFFRIINPVVPFTYAIGAMREAMFGVNFQSLKIDLLVLTAYFIVFTIAGLHFKKACMEKVDPLWHKLSSSRITEN